MEGMNPITKKLSEMNARAEIYGGKIEDSQIYNFAALFDQEQIFDEKNVDAAVLARIRKQIAVDMQSAQELLKEGNRELNAIVFQSLQSSEKLLLSEDQEKGEERKALVKQRCLMAFSSEMNDIREMFRHEREEDKKALDAGMKEDERKLLDDTNPEEAVKNLFDLFDDSLKKGIDPRLIVDEKRIVCDRLTRSNPLSRLILARTQAHLRGLDLSAKEKTVYPVGSPEEKAVYQGYHSEFTYKTATIVMDLYRDKNDALGEGGCLFHEMSHMADSLYSESRKKPLSEADLFLNLAAFWQEISTLRDDLLRKKAAAKDQKEEENLSRRIERIHVLWQKYENRVDYRVELEGILSEELKVKPCRTFEITTSDKHKGPFLTAIKSDYEYFTKTYCAAAFGITKDPDKVLTVIKKQLFNIYVLPILVKYEEETTVQSSDKKLLTKEKEQEELNAALIKAYNELISLQGMTITQKQQWLKDNHPVLTPNVKQRGELVGINDMFGGLLSIQSAPQGAEAELAKRKVTMGILTNHADDPRYPKYWENTDFFNEDAWAEMMEVELGGKVESRILYFQYMPNAFRYFKQMRRDAVTGQI